MTLIEQIVESYFNNEWWSKPKMDRMEAWKYHEVMLARGNIITISDGEKLCGYVEYWRLTYEQWGRIICGEVLSPLDIDLQTGYIAYVASTYILPEYRHTHVYLMLRDRFIEMNKDCAYFVGEARRKRSAPIKVFTRKDIESWVEKKRPLQQM